MDRSPAMRPRAEAVMPCPLCHAPLRNTAERCTRCGAERHFGPKRTETALGMVIGSALLFGVSLLLFPLSFCTVLLALLGLGAGFLYAHIRFGIDRWLRH